MQNLFNQSFGVHTMPLVINNVGGEHNIHTSTHAYWTIAILINYRHVLACGWYLPGLKSVLIGKIETVKI